MISYLIFGLVFVLLVVFAVLARKHWHWSNIVFVILTFITAVVAITGMAKVFEKRSVVIRDYEQSIVNLEKAVKERDLAIFGPPESFTYTRESLRGTNELLNLELIGQGRVWMNGSVEKRGDNYVFKFKSSRDASDPTFGKMKDVMLYVFADAPADQLTYPSLYLGTFRVQEEALESLELAPQFVVSNDYLTRPTTWSLFEKMPIDRWSVFHDANGVLDKTNLESLHNLRQKLISEIAPASQFNLDPDSREYEIIIDRIVFDGMAIGDIEKYIEQHKDTRKTSRFEPAPQEVFVRYRFDDKSKRSYLVDANGTLDLNGEFSSTGQAYNQQLHYGKEVTFSKGEEVEIDLLTADGYQRADQTQIPPFAQGEPVTEVGRYYRRKLEDFPFVLSEVRRQSEDFVKRTADVKLQNEVTQLILDDTLAQERDRDDIIARLQQDRDNLRTDADQINSLLQQRASELDQIRQRMEALEMDLTRMREKVGYSRPDSGDRLAGR